MNSWIIIYIYSAWTRWNYFSHLDASNCHKLVSRYLYTIPKYISPFFSFNFGRTLPNGENSVFQNLRLVTKTQNEHTYHLAPTELRYKRNFYNAMPFVVSTNCGQQSVQMSTWRTYLASKISKNVPFFLMHWHWVHRCGCLESLEQLQYWWLSKNWSATD